MTPEAQRIAIAEAFPDVIRANTTASGYWPENPKWEWYDGESWHQCHKNDPINDLNAMHRACEYLTGDEIDKFQDELSKLCGGKFWKYCQAPASKRAEAFLRSLNLWT